MSLPPTGTQISMARTGRAYNNVAPGNQTVSIGNTAPVMRLNARIGRGATTQTAFSSVFGGRSTPFTY